jgi:hypothetical protein
MDDCNIINTNNCNYSNWVYMKDSKLWWKIPGVNKCKKKNLHKCIINNEDDNKVIVLQDKKCFRCSQEINNNICFLFVFGFFCRNNIFCNFCIKIVDSKKNITSQIIKREYM